MNAYGLFLGIAVSEEEGRSEVTGKCLGLGFRV
jgi:hypothetical protein